MVAKSTLSLARSATESTNGVLVVIVPPLVSEATYRPPVSSADVEPSDAPVSPGDRCDASPEMYAKQDPRLMEEAGLAGDLERYKRAVAATRYYGARVGAGVACGDALSGDGRIRAVLPATIPSAKLLYVPNQCYYADEVSDGWSPEDNAPQCFSSRRHSPELVPVRQLSPIQVSLQGLPSPVHVSPDRIPLEHRPPNHMSPERIPQRHSPETMSPKLMSLQRLSSELISPGLMSPERLSLCRLSPERLSPRRMSPHRYAAVDEQRASALLTKRTHSSPVKYSTNPPMMDTKRNTSSRSPPGRTRIPVAHNSRSCVKETNVAYFAASPPSHPISTGFNPPSMCQRKDVKHSCLRSGGVEGDAARRCERAVAEAVRAGREPAELGLPPAAYKHVPPRKSVESLKDKTTSLRNRLDQLRTRRSPENLRNKFTDLPETDNFSRKDLFGECSKSAEITHKEVLIEHIETKDILSKEILNQSSDDNDSKVKDIVSEIFESQDRSSDVIITDSLGSPVPKNKENEALENHALSTKGSPIECLDDQNPEINDIMSEHDEDSRLGSENDEIWSEFLENADHKSEVLSQDTTGKDLYGENLDEKIPEQECFESQKVDVQSDELPSDLSDIQAVQLREAYREIFESQDAEHVGSPGENFERDEVPVDDREEGFSDEVKEGPSAPQPSESSQEAAQSACAAEPGARTLGAGSSDGTVRRRSDLTLKDSLSNMSSELSIDMLAEGLLIDIVDRFPSHEDLCKDLTVSITTPEDATARDGTASGLVRQLSQLDEESCDERRGPDTSEFSGYDTNNSRDEEMLSAHLGRLARGFLERRPCEEFVIEPAPPTPDPDQCNGWSDSRDGGAGAGGYSHSTSTGLGFITHPSRTSSPLDTDNDARRDAGGAVRQAAAGRRRESERDGELRRTPSRSKAVQVAMPPPLVHCCHTQSHLVLSKRSSHRQVGSKAQNHGDEELAYVPERSASGRRLLADLKRSQRMLGFVDAVLHDDTGTSSDGMGDAARRLRSRHAIEVQSRQLVSLPKKHSRCSDCRASFLGGPQCMRQLQQLRNEQLMNIQRQMQQIVNLNKVIDTIQSPSHD